VEKMSKSLGNSIGITDTAEDMYGKVMSLPDDQMSEYFRLLSSGEWESDRARFEKFQQGHGDPMSLKHRLAELIVTRIHDADEAGRAKAHFQRVVQQKGVPDDLPEHELAVAAGGGIALLDAIDAAGLIKSRSEGRRLIEQGAVSVDGERAQDALAALPAGDYVVRVGKRRYVRLAVRVQ
jgi:tyrosyl-tRNA synthetase